MAGFTETALLKKLEDLNPSQQSIQTLSLWLIHHRKHCINVVKMWTRELISAEESRQLTLMYLANDVIQNSRKKGPEYGKEFGSVLKKTFEIMGGDACSDKTRKSLFRLLQIWEERGIYEKNLIEEFKTALGKLRKDKSRPDSPPRKKSKIREITIKKQKEKLSSTNHKSENSNGVKSKESLKLSPKYSNPADVPEPEELIKSLTELENSASSDASVRERIASFPPEVSEIRLLENIEDRKSGEALLLQVNEAVELLAGYNTRLINEMGDRKKVTVMLKDFVQSQKELLEQAEIRLTEYREKLKNICNVRNELKLRLENLPDLTQLPDVTGGLAPLPSAGDLFSMS